MFVNNPLHLQACIRQLAPDCITRNFDLVLWELDAYVTPS